MDDPFLESLAADWRDTDRRDADTVAWQIMQKLHRMKFQAGLAGAGGVLLLVLATAFAIWAWQRHSLLMAIGALAFASGAPILFGAWSSMRKVLALHYDLPPHAHLDVLQKVLDSDRRRLIEARGCAVILAVASAAVFILVMTGAQPSVAAIPATAWALTAAGVEVYRARLRHRLKREQDALDALHKFPP